MRRLMLALVVLSSGFGFAPAEDLYLWLRLTENRVMTNSKYERVAHDTLFVLRGGRLMAVLLNEITQLRVMEPASMLDGALIGGGSGLAAGAAVGYSLRVSSDQDVQPGTFIVAFGVIGAIVGGTVAALEKPGDVIDLSAMNAEQKAILIRDLTSKTRR